MGSLSTKQTTMVVVRVASLWLVMMTRIKVVQYWELRTGIGIPGNPTDHDGKVKGFLTSNLLKQGGDMDGVMMHWKMLRGGRCR